MIVYILCRVLYLKLLFKFVFIWYLFFNENNRVFVGKKKKIRMIGKMFDFGVLFFRGILLGNLII